MPKSNGKNRCDIRRTENPFEWIDEEAVVNPDFSITDFGKTMMDFAKNFSLSAHSAKIIWLSRPLFQEEFCRNRITNSKARGGSEYGNKNWLRRRYDLPQEELDEVFADLWDQQGDRVAAKFLSIVDVKRIVESQFTTEAQLELAELQSRYGNKEKASL